MQSLCNACGIRFNKLKAGKRCRSTAGPDAFVDECPAVAYSLPIVRTVSGRRSRPSQKSLLTIKARKPSGLVRLNSVDSSSSDSCVTRKGRRSPLSLDGTPQSRRAIFSDDEVKEEEDHAAACLIDDEAAAQMLLILLEASCCDQLS